MNQNRYNKERIVTIKGILHLMSSYRRWILPFILLLALLSGGFQVVKLHRNILSYRNKPATVEKQIKVDEAEFYMVKSVVETEEIVAQKQEYLDHSILMRIDPMHKKYGSLRYVFSFDDYEVHNNAGIANAYLTEFMKSDTLDQIKRRAGADEDVSYLREIITADATSVPGTFAVTVCHYDEEKAKKLLTAIESFFKSKTSLGFDIEGDFTVGMMHGEVTEQVDTALLDSQTAKKADLANHQNALTTRYAQLSDKAVKYLELYREAKGSDDYVEGQPLVKTEPVTAPDSDYFKACLKGLLAGLLAAVVCSFVICALLYLFSPVLVDAKTFSDMYGIFVYGCLSAKAQTESHVKYEMVANLLAGRKSEGKVAILTSSSDLAKADEMNCLIGQIKAAGLPVEVACSVDEDPQEIKKLNGVADVFLLEKVGKSRHSKLEAQMHILSEMSAHVIGALIIDRK